MKKFISVTISVILIVSLLCACGAQKLADSFDEETVIEKVKEVVGVINSLDYDNIILELRDDLQESLTAAKLEEAWGKKLDEIGGFKEYKTVVVNGSSDKNSDEEYAVCVLICTYESGKATYTLTFDTDYELIGLYMK